MLNKGEPHEEPFGKCWILFWTPFPNFGAAPSRIVGTHPSPDKYRLSLGESFMELFHRGIRGGLLVKSSTLSKEIKLVEKSGIFGSLTCFSSVWDVNENHSGQNFIFYLQLAGVLSALFTSFSKFPENFWFPFLWLSLSLSDATPVTSRS